MGVCGVKVNDLNALKYGLRPGIKDIIIFATDKFVSVVVYYQPHIFSIETKQTVFRAKDTQIIPCFCIVVESTPGI